jgi:RND family efflux transporter MFP subunit
MNPSERETTSRAPDSEDQLTEKRVHGGVSKRQQRADRKRLFIYWLIPMALFAVLAVVVLVMRRNSSRALAEETSQNAVPYVSLVHATPMSSESELVLPGRLEAYIEAPIYARTNGYLKNWYRDIGSHVKKGELLADIETPEVDQQLEQARADLSTAQANLGLSQTTAERYQDLLKTDSVSKQEVDNAVGDYQAKKSTEQSALANVHRLEDLESFKHVYAPFDGVITQRNTDIGQLINAGNGGMPYALFMMAQVDPLRVFVAVPQTYAPSIRRGLEACLELQEMPGRRFCGSVARTADAIDESTRTLNTEVDVPNHSGTLLPGAYAEVHFALRTSTPPLSLPINALLFRPEGTMAAVVGTDSKVQLRRLTIGRDLGSSVEVLGGLDQSDSVVVNPPDALEQGEQVRVAPAAGEQPEQGPRANGVSPPPAPSGQQGSGQRSPSGQKP